PKHFLENFKAIWRDLGGVLFFFSLFRQKQLGRASKGVGGKAAPRGRGGQTTISQGNFLGPRKCEFPKSKASKIGRHLQQRPRLGSSDLLDLGGPVNP